MKKKRQLKNEMMPFLTADEIDSMVSKLAQQIDYDYEGKDLVFISPLKGSIHLLADLVRKVRVPCQIDFVYLQSVERGGAIKIVKDISTNIAGKHVIIAEEVIDSGRKLSFLRNRLFASAPASLKILALLDKPARRELPIKADYVGKVIDDRYVVGYGMDSEEMGRNYPDIYTLKN